MRTNNELIQTLLENKEENHMMPFFWQHGEDEATLREYMGAIQNANCGAVCVESRPHPDFCGPKWWQDMDIILDEAKKRGMKVWILDDSHFPTGYANGALKEKPDSLCRQSIYVRKYPLGKDYSGTLNLAEKKLLSMKEKKPTGMAAFLNLQPARTFDDDSIIGITVQERGGKSVDVTDCVDGTVLRWEKPAGEWTLCVCGKTRNAGPHRDYINMTSPESCKILLETVYEPHWKHYSEEFGKTIAGFFSDEPELGNAELYIKGNVMGCDQDLPWSDCVEADLSARLGKEWKMMLPMLWDELLPDSLTVRKNAAMVRTVYMDVLTKRVRNAFSEQIGGWCREHGVQYIGHMIEDEGQHCRTGSGLGHYFRGLQGQDMSGVDDIGGQILPQGEEEPKQNSLGSPRNGEFYHYGLAKLAESAAQIEPQKHGNAMCEVFGNYGWAEGIRLEKYLADHLLVRGITQFVPHAFSAAPFPDPDCPPHFYAHGHNPQYRWFGKLMAYMNRVATITSADLHIAHVAILYHGEQEWADCSAMPIEKPLHKLYDAQIDCHILPADVFSETERYHTRITDKLEVNGHTYTLFIVPGSTFISEAAAKGIDELVKRGVTVLFVGKKPRWIAETEKQTSVTWNSCPTVSLDELLPKVFEYRISHPKLMPADNRIRILQVGEPAKFYFVTNEGAGTYDGFLTLPGNRKFFGYDALQNQCMELAQTTEINTRVKLTLEPLHSLAIVCGNSNEKLKKATTLSKSYTELRDWTRKTCSAIEYPNFSCAEEIQLPDRLAEERPEFSGFVRYETVFEWDNTSCVLDIEDAGECVEVFLNGESQGLQLIPPFRYDLSGKVKPHDNQLAIEVATTLERKMYPLLSGYQKMLAQKPHSQSGLNGRVVLREDTDAVGIK